MPDWATSLIATAVGAAVAFAAVWMQVRYQRSQAREAERAALRARWREIFAPLVTILAEPPRRGGSFISDPKRLSNEEWAEIRAGLGAAIVIQPARATEIRALLEVLAAWRVGGGRPRLAPPMTKDQAKAFDQRQEREWEDFLKLRDRAIELTDGLVSAEPR